MSTDLPAHRQGIRADAALVGELSGDVAVGVEYGDAEHELESPVAAFRARGPSKRTEIATARPGSPSSRLESSSMATDSASSLDVAENDHHTVRPRRSEWPAGPHNRREVSSRVDHRPSFRRGSNPRAVGTRMGLRFISVE